MRTIYLTELIVINDSKKRAYLVTKVVNSVQHSIGSTLSQDYVHGLCDDADWKVVITGGES